MTNEEAKTNLEKLLLLYDDGMIDFSVIRESVKVAISALRAIDQYKGERDIAVEQLKELGYELGEKIRTDTDCVSRQAAIDVLSLGKEILSRVLDDIDVVGTEREKYSWGLGLIESNIKDIEELPSAQPTLQPTCNNLATDCISRQAAIDEMTNTLWHYPNECYRNLNVYEFAKGLAEIGLKSVPSAQPDIIRCKDCKYITEHYDTDGNAPYWTCSEWDSGTDYDGFCHYAERRTDERFDRKTGGD